MKIFEKRPLAIILCVMLGGFSFFADFTWQIKLICAAVIMVAMWKMFIKLGEPGWVGIVPFYNMYKLSEHLYGNGWNMLICFIPVVGIPYFMYKVFKCFGAEEFPAILLAILAPIGMVVYGFNKAEWIPPVIE